MVKLESLKNMKAEVIGFKTERRLDEEYKAGLVSLLSSYISYLEALEYANEQEPS